jgi:hypothetical protein
VSRQNAQQVEALVDHGLPPPDVRFDQVDQLPVGHGRGQATPCLMVLLEQSLEARDGEFERRLAACLLEHTAAIDPLRCVEAVPLRRQGLGGRLPDADKAPLGGLAKEIAFSLAEAVDQRRNRVGEPQLAGQICQVHAPPFVADHQHALIHTPRDIWGWKGRKALRQLRYVALD